MLSQKGVTVVHKSSNCTCHLKVPVGVFAFEDGNIGKSRYDMIIEGFELGVDAKG
jgi:hypothetical protein